MANAATLTSLEAIVRARLNLTNLSTVSSADMQTFIKSAAAQLYEMVANRHRDYFVTSYMISLAAGVDKYALPADFRSANEIFLLCGTAPNTQKILLRQFNGAQYQNQQPTYFPQWPTMYRIRGGVIEFTPVPGSDAAAAVEMLYVPQWPGITNPDVSFASYLPNGWERWVEMDVCCQVAARMREPEYYGAYMKERERAEAAVIAASSIRDEQPSYMVDVYSGGWGAFRPGG